MKLIIKHPDSCPIGAQPQRRILGVLNFKPRGTDALSSYEIQRTPVAFDDVGSLIVEASYTPANRVLSIITGHQIGNDEAHVFSTVTESEFVPASFCFRLSTGQYIEFYIQHEATTAPQPSA